MIRAILINVFFLLVGFGTFGQTKVKFTPVQLQSDFDLFIETFLNVHPAPFEFIKENDLKEIENSLRAELNHEMTELEFHVIVRKYVRHVGCGHTSPRPSEDWYTVQRESSKLLPISFHLLGDELYVKRAYRRDSVLTPGTRIFTVNDIAVSEILGKMREIQERDGLTEIFVEAKIQRMFSTYLLFLYGVKDEYHLSYRTERGKIAVISLEAGYPEGAKALTKVTPPVLHSMSGAKFWMDSVQSNLAVMDINSFERKGFKKFYKNVFEELDEKKIEHLVIDLRNNGGGYFPNGNRLLTYLMPSDFDMNFSRPRKKIKKNKHLKSPFYVKLSKFIFNTIPDRDKGDPDRNYVIPYKKNKKHPFGGKVYVLTNGYSFSLAGLVPTKLQSRAGATIIGTETGGGENGSYAILTSVLVLPETKVRIVLPHYFMDHDVTPTLFGHGVIPNYEIPKTIESKLSLEDEDMEKVYELVQKE